MLDALDRRARAAGLADVRCVRAGFLSYMHPGGPVDGIYSRHVLHQLPDFWKALALGRIAGMLRRGGVFRLRDLIFDFAPQEAEAVFAQWFAGAAEDAADGYTALDDGAHIRSEHSTFRWLLEPMHDAAGFNSAMVEYRARLYGAYPCITR